MTVPLAYYAAEQTHPDHPTAPATDEEWCEANGIRAIPSDDIPEEPDMHTTNKRDNLSPLVLLMTDSRGRAFAQDMTEPEPSSVVLAEGEFGNAYQRYFSDGLWHRGREARTWEEMLTERNLVLVYDAPIRISTPPVIRPEQVDGAITGRWM